MRTSSLLSLLISAALFLNAETLRAALSDELQYVATQSHSLSYGKTAEFYSKSNDGSYGFSLDGVMSSSADATPYMDVNHRDKLTTLLVNGTYDLPARLKGELDFHPFLVGGAGLALYDSMSSRQSNTQSSSTQTEGSMVPVFRFGGGVAYKVDDRLGLSLSYKTGFTKGNINPVDMQMVDVGLKFRF